MVTISAFDFDGTITKRDTLPLFIKHVLGPWRYFLTMAKMSPRLLWALLGFGDRDKTKEMLLSHAVRRMPLRQYDQYAYSFSQKYAHILRPKAIEAIEQAFAAGHRVVVVTASPEEWVRFFFTNPRVEVVGTRLEHAQGMLTGKFASPNCRGPEKLRRLQKHIPPAQWERLIVYGDASGDRELLEAADQSHYKPFR